MEKWTVENFVGSSDQRENVDKAEEDDGMSEKCCGVGRETIELR